MGYLVLVSRVLYVQNISNKAADKAWGSGLIAEGRNDPVLLWFILQAGTLQTMAGCLSCAAAG